MCLPFPIQSVFQVNQMDDEEKFPQIMPANKCRRNGRIRKLPICNGPTPVFQSMWELDVNFARLNQKIFFFCLFTYQNHPSNSHACYLPSTKVFSGSLFSSNNPYISLWFPVALDIHEWFTYTCLVHMGIFSKFWY